MRELSLMLKARFKVACVFIGVGHGGIDAGAVSGKHVEKSYNLTIALACRDYLTAHGVIVGMSRTKDEKDSLAEEIKEANAFKPDFALDIHNNAGKGDGAEAWYDIKGKAKKLATNVIAEIEKLGQYPRGIKTRANENGKDYHGFIREVKCPSIIVECAFIDSADVEIIDTLTEQKAMGEAVARGVLKTLGIKDKGVTEMSREELEIIVTEMLDAREEKVYHFWKELPVWACTPLKALYDAGYFEGASDADLNIKQTKLECLVVMARAFRDNGILQY